MGRGTHEASIGMEYCKYDSLNRPDSSKQIVLSGNLYAADISCLDIIMRYDFMVSNAIGALADQTTLVSEDRERLTSLSTDHAPGIFWWTRDEEERIVRAVKTMSTKFYGNRGGHLREYGMAPQVYNPVVLRRGGKKPQRDTFASRHAVQLN